MFKVSLLLFITFALGAWIYTVFFVDLEIVADDENVIISQEKKISMLKDKNLENTFRAINEAKKGERKIAEVPKTENIMPDGNKAEPLIDISEDRKKDLLETLESQVESDELTAQALIESGDEDTAQVILDRVNQARRQIIEIKDR